MATKLNPGKFDCYSKALPDEPTFTLLARDPDFFRLVKKWAKRRMKAVQCGDRPESDRDMVVEAEQCAWDGQEWRKKNNGAWRKLQATKIPVGIIPVTSDYAGIPEEPTPTVNVKFSEKITSDPTITMAVSYQTENVVGFDKVEFEKLVIETFHKAKAQNRL